MIARVVYIHREALDKSHPTRRSSEAWLEFFEKEMSNYIEEEQTNDDTSGNE